MVQEQEENIFCWTVPLVGCPIQLSRGGAMVSMLAKCAGLVLLAALATATTNNAASTWAGSADYCSPGLCSFGVPCVTRACRRPTIRGGAYALNGSVPGDPGGALPSGWCPSDESCADLRWLRAGGARRAHCGKSDWCSSLRHSRRTRLRLARLLQCPRRMLGQH